MTKKARRDITLWSPVKLCLCCGKFVVLLRRPDYDGKAQPKKWIACMFKGWDGSPYYAKGRNWRTGGNAVPHERRQFAIRMAALRPKEEPVDPFFSLETEPSGGNAAADRSCRSRTEAEQKPAENAYEPSGGDFSILD